MSQRKTAIKVPHLRLVGIRLLSLSYRATRAEPSLYERMEVGIKGSVNYGFYARRKNSFKARVTQEIKAAGVSFRVRHEARFASDVPISEGLFDDETFNKYVVNMMLPFGSELFATLTGKSFSGPLIAPGELPPNTKTEE
jgi:hypothetical protein